MRCVACNKILTQNELSYDKKSTGLDCDICSKCRLVSQSEYNMSYDHQYEQQDITERGGVSSEGPSGSGWGEFYYS